MQASRSRRANPARRPRRRAALPQECENMTDSSRKGNKKNETQMSARRNQQRKRSREWAPRGAARRSGTTVRPTARTSIPPPGACENSRRNCPDSAYRMPLRQLGQAKYCLAPSARSLVADLFGQRYPIRNGPSPESSRLCHWRRTSPKPYTQSSNSSLIRSSTEFDAMVVGSAGILLAMRYDRLPCVQ